MNRRRPADAGTYPHRPAAAYLVQVARTTKGGRYRKSAKIEALRECKDEILEAARAAIAG